MGRAIEKIVHEFNLAAPPPKAPRDNTVFQNKTSPFGFADAKRHFADNDNEPPTWQDAMPEAGEWFKAVSQTPLGRKLQEAFDAHTDDGSTFSRTKTAFLIRAQIKALYDAERLDETMGYRITDPFHPLEDLGNPVTVAWIQAENKRTDKFTAGSVAKKKCESFLRQAWRERVAKRFSTTADGNACMGYLYRQDIWTYPSVKRPKDAVYGGPGKYLGTHNGQIIEMRQSGPDAVITARSAGEHKERHKRMLAGGPGNRLRGAFMHNGLLFTSFDHNCTDTLKIYKPDGTHVADAPLPACRLKAVSVDEATGNLVLRMQTFTRPECDYIYDIAANSLAPAPGTPPSPLDDCIVEQIWAPSKDGVEVPMWVIRRPDTALDGTAAVKIFAYGAARIPLHPNFSESAAQWVRAGGIYVQANLRGGDELGPAWAEQGMRMRRQNVVDDLVACARALTRRGYTVPQRTAIMGRSNGGWLMLETLVQNSYPFGAVISHVPVSDLNRITYGGDSYPGKSSRAEFAERLRLSPYHNVQAGRKLSPVMILSGDQDTVAHTWHALKMAAALQSSTPDNLCLLRVRKGTGHKPEFIPTEDLIAEESDIHAFIEKCIGPIDQNEYKALAAAGESGPQPLSQKCVATAPA